MPSSPGVEILTDAVLSRLFEPGSFRRGQQYAAEDRVELLPTVTAPRW